MLAPQLRAQSALVPPTEAMAARVLAAREIDALVLVPTPGNPAARRLAGEAARTVHNLRLLGVPDGAAMIERRPRLQALTVQAGLLGADPRLPAEDLATIDASYRLMARASLLRSTAAAVTQHLFELPGRPCRGASGRRFREGSVLRLDG